MTPPDERDTTRRHFDARDEYWFTIYDHPHTFPGYNLRAQHDAALAHVSAHLAGPGRVLDVGCGAGYTALALARQGHTVSGVDLAPGMVARGKREAEARGLEVDLRVAAAEALPYPPDHFDAVLALGLMGNLREVEPVLRELSRVLAPGGLVLLSIPNACGLQRWLSLPRTAPLILGHRFRRARRRMANVARRLVGRPVKPVDDIRYGRAAVPHRFVRQLRAAGFVGVRYTSVTFGPFLPLGLDVISAARHIAISDGITKRRWLARLLNWGGHIVLHQARKPGLPSTKSLGSSIAPSSHR